jgi:hypothetical protein
MQIDSKKKQKPPVKSEEKLEKLSSALRKNLLRRKAVKNKNG